MLTPQIQLQLARERHAGEIRHAEDRLLIGHRPSSIRRSLGHSFIAIGARLAAEPSPRLARTR